jgi:16S rRNA (cytosine1402-N4)-methyltransferase
MDFHQPVLLQETLNLLDVKPKKIYIDATLGNGGHTIEILKKGGIVYGLDADPANLQITVDRLKKMKIADDFHPVNSNFSNLKKLIGDIIPENISGLLLDLGLSSGQQKSTGRGFSFNDSLSLDMRLDSATQTLTAENIINTYSFDQLYDIFTKLAQEKFSKPLILRIITERQKKPIKSGLHLAGVIRDYYRQKHVRTAIDPATKIFLALRIVVNQELQNLQSLLNDTLLFLPPGCNVVIISFHSGEDRLVKQFIRQNMLVNRITNTTVKPIVPEAKEILNNPLSRSAVLRSYRIK